VIVLAVSGTGLTDMLTHPFIQHALVAGTGIAAASGLVGYFVVLRGQVFSGDLLSHVAFTGALAALAFGVDARLGLFVATVAVGLGIGVLGDRGHADDVVIGSVFTWVLGLGVLFVSIYTTSTAASDSTASVHVLFGSIFGLTTGQATVAALVGGGVCLVLILIARPLLFASLDQAVARARGVPVRLLGIGFLGLVGVCAGEATQAVGALLLLGLLAAPAGAAQRLTSRAWVAFWLSGGLAVASLWVGVTVSYLFASIPPSFAVMATATLLYAAAFAVRTIRDASASPRRAGPLRAPVAERSRR
jgi:zinc/manganese transport system permease protein